MDTPLPTQTPQPQSPLPTISMPVQVPAIPISDKPLTLDPNQMPVQPAPLAKVAVQIPMQQLPTVPEVVVAPAISPTPKPAPQLISGHKERAPSFQAPVSEYVRPSEQMPSLPPEVAEAGIEVAPNIEQPQLDASHKAAGIEPARAAIPVVIPQTTSIYLPYSPSQAKQVEKESSIGESRHWLAQLTEYIIRKFQKLNT